MFRDTDLDRPLPPRATPDLTAEPLVEERSPLADVNFRANLPPEAPASELPGRQVDAASREQISTGEGSSFVDSASRALRPFVQGLKPLGVLFERRTYEAMGKAIEETLRGEGEVPGATYRLAGECRKDLSERPLTGAAILKTACAAIPVAAGVTAATVEAAGNAFLDTAKGLLEAASKVPVFGYLGLGGALLFGAAGGLLWGAGKLVKEGANYASGKVIGWFDAKTPGTPPGEI